MSLITLVIPCSSSDAGFFFEWFIPFASSNQFSFRYLIVLNGGFIPKCYKEIKIESVTIVSIPTPLFPGQARNVGLDYIDDGYIAFIDSRTTISSDWLKFAHDFHLNHPDASCLGSVQYIATKPWHLPLLASTYGLNQLSCLPGSIIHRKAFSRVGYFLPNVRAGEDIDWIWRAFRHQLFSDDIMSPPLKYSLDARKDFFYYLLKWFRNYSCSSGLPYISDSQRTFYAFFLFVSVTFVSYVWNSLFADWNESSPFYIPFVSRSVVSAFLIFYLVIRCIYLPIKKGMSKYDLVKTFVLVIPISIALDVVKLLAFFPSMLRRARNFF